MANGRDSKGKFTKGNSGKPKGCLSDRTKIVNSIIKLFHKEKNHAKLLDALQKRFDKMPIESYEKYYLPFIDINKLTNVEETTDEIIIRVGK